jgi:hypothetical protein
MAAAMATAAEKLKTEFCHVTSMVRVMKADFFPVMFRIKFETKQRNQPQFRTKLVCDLLEGFHCM